MTKMDKHCHRCKKLSAETVCAQCSERGMGHKEKREIYVGHNGSYGYRLIAGFNLMRYIEDEWADREGR